MKISIISFTENGARIGERLQTVLNAEGNETDAGVCSAHVNPERSRVTGEKLAG